MNVETQNETKYKVVEWQIKQYNVIKNWDVRFYSTPALYRICKRYHRRNIEQCFFCSIDMSQEYRNLHKMKNNIGYNDLLSEINPDD